MDDRPTNSMTDSQELATLVGEFGKVYGRWIHGVVQAEAGTTPARARLLAALQCNGACKMAQLSDQLGVTPRNITKLVDGLEDERLVARAAHPDDRRATLIHLTEEGVLAAKETMLAHHAAFESLYDTLSADERTTMGRILGKLIAELGRLETSR